MDDSSFYSQLAVRAQRRVDRAVLVATYLSVFKGLPTIGTREIGKHFERAGLVAPNQTELAQSLRRDNRVSCKDGKIRPLKAGVDYFNRAFPMLEREVQVPTVEESLPTEISSLPYLPPDYGTRLKVAMQLYRAIHALENSMRGLVQAVLQAKFGDAWWERAANASMKRKHQDRLDKERDRKWLPARSDLGPLYSIDWSDLITLMRNHEEQFIPYIGEANFLHRYADMGLLRHVIAHNGFLEDESEATRALLALQDWRKQLASPG